MTEATMLDEKTAPAKTPEELGFDTSYHSPEAAAERERQAQTRKLMSARAQPAKK